MSVSATPASATAAVGGLPRVSMGIMVLLSIAIAFANAGLQSVLPAIGRRIGIPDMLIASVFVISSTFYVLTSAYWAHLSDMIGRKPLMVVGSLGLTLAMGLSGVAVSLGLAHVIGPILCFALFALGRSLNGILGAATGPAMQAYIADHTEGRGRVRAISTNAGANGFGTIFGPMLAPLFVTPFFGLAGPLYAFCLFGLFVMIATRIWLPEKRFPVEVREVLRDPFGAPRRHAEQQGEKRPSIWLDKRVQPFLIFALLSTMCGMGFVQTVGFTIIDVMKLPPEEAIHYIAGALTIGAIVTVICQWGLIPMLSLSTSALMCWGAGIAALGALVTAVGGGYWHIVVGFGVNSVGLSLLRPGNAAGMSLAVGPADQGRVAGAMGQIGGMFGFSAVFVALHTLHPALPYWIFVVTLAGLAGYTILNPALNGQRQPARA